MGFWSYLVVRRGFTVFNNYFLLLTFLDNLFIWITRLQIYMYGYGMLLLRAYKFAREDLKICSHADGDSLSMRRARSSECAMDES